MNKIERIEADYSLIHNSNDCYTRVYFTMYFNNGGNIKRVIYTNKNSTGNCQIDVIGSLENFLYKDFEKEEIPIVKKALLDFAEKLGKPCLMVDVKPYVLKRLKQLFKKEDFILEAPYVSTNGNKLTICIIKLSDYYED